MRILSILTLAMATAVGWSAPQSTGSGEAAAQDPPKQEIQVDDPKHQKDIDSDREVGERVSKLVAEDMEFSENQEYIDRVNRIGTDIADIANKNQVHVSWGDKRLSPFEYQFFVLKGEELNAFSIPGGYIYLFEGLIEFSESDDELAGVIAHEIAHASFRHIATLQKERSKLDVLNLIALAIALTNMRNAANVLIPAQLVTLGMTSGWSVKAEKAADTGGLQYMMLSKYNPLGALTFMERLGYTNRFQPKWQMGIYETHPPSEERAKEILAFLHGEEIAIRRSEVTTSLSAVSEETDKGVQVSFGEYSVHLFAGDGAQDRADRAVVRLNRFFDAIPALYHVKVRRDSTLFGRGRELFSVEQPDAAAAGDSIEESAIKALRSMKRILLNLPDRMWSSSASRLRASASRA